MKKRVLAIAIGVAVASFAMACDTKGGEHSRSENPDKHQTAHAIHDCEAHGKCDEVSDDSMKAIHDCEAHGQCDKRGESR